MKRFLPFLIIALTFSSCQEDVKFSKPGFQALKDDVFWRANDIRAYVSQTGELTINAFTAYEILTLSTRFANEGTYVLGTTNTNNFIIYTNTFENLNLEYATIPVPGPVLNVGISNTGSSYVTSSSPVATTGGSGSGLTVTIEANASGLVTKVAVSASGNNYTSGDIVTIAGGNVNAKIRVLNVQNSNGEIIITEYDDLNRTISGKFKFIAPTTNDSPFAGPLLTYSNGEFYKIPIYPSL